MLRWMAPFLSFTAEEAWKIVRRVGIDLHGNLLPNLPAPDEALLAKWARIREIRDAVNKDIEALRADGKVGSSLQANVALHGRCRRPRAAGQPGRRPEVRLHHVCY